MNKEPRVFLEDIRDSIVKIEEYTRGFNFRKFNQQFETQDAVMRRLAIIGEAAKNLSAKIKEKYPEIPWHEIAGMRNILIHEYAGVKLERVWKAVTDDLAPLKVAVKKILDNL